MAPSAATILAARVVKVRPVGQLVDIVLEADGVELNALTACDRGESHPVVGDHVIAVVLTAAILTTPLEEEACERPVSDS
jgi:ABC-type molybdate transport system ATPase subunit